MDESTKKFSATAFEVGFGAAAVNLARLSEGLRAAAVAMYRRRRHRDLLPRGDERRLRSVGKLAFLAGAVVAILALAGCGVDSIGDGAPAPAAELGAPAATAAGLDGLGPVCARGAIAWDECPRPTCCPAGTWACLDGSCAEPPAGEANGPNWCVWDGVGYTGTSFCSTWYPPTTCADLGYEEWTCRSDTFACCPAGYTGCDDGSNGGSCAPPGGSCADIGLPPCTLAL